VSQLFTASQQSALRFRFIPQEEDQIPVSYINTSGFVGSDLQVTLDTRYLRVVQAPSFATSDQGILADSALQPGEAALPTTTITAGTGLTGGGDLSANRTISLNSASIASLALADTALQSAPVLKVYQATATGATPESFTLPATPATGSEVIVFVEGLPHHLSASDPPSTGDFYRSGTTVKVDTVLNDRVSVYYMA